MKQKAFIASSVLLAATIGGYAVAAIPVPAEDRDASFLPPPVALTEPLTPQANAAEAEKPTADKPVQAAEGAPDKGAEKASAPQAPAPETSAPSSADEKPAAPAPDKLAPVSLGVPVVEKPLADIDPQSVGLLRADEGGLGASLWTGTPRMLAERFLFTTSLPTSSASLNDLAYRLLASVAAMPTDEGTDDPSRRSFTALRVEKLVSLGRVDDAWKLAAMVKPDTIDDMTLRLMTEATLLQSDSAAICEKIPALIAAHAKQGESAVEWQKSLLVCQMRADDMKGVQLSYDMLREQKAPDDVFLQLVSKNILGGSKVLPRHLTPLRPLNLALLRTMNAPLPSEVYARPEASMIPQLLAERALDDKARLQLAERAATQGLIDADILAKAYTDAAVTDSDAATLLAGSEQSPRARAVLFRALAAEANDARKIELAQRFLGGLDEITLTGSIGKLIASKVASISPDEEHRQFAPQGARLFAMTGDKDHAKAWLSVARDLAPRFAEVGTQLASHWPLFVLSGLIDSKTYDQGLKDWLSVALTPDAAAGKEKQRRAVAADTLLLLAAAGNSVPETAWLRVMDAGVSSKETMPAPILLERLAQAAQAERKGEVVMLALSLIDSSAGEPSVLVSAEIIRALRTAGLPDAARAFAREAVTRLVIP